MNEALQWTSPYAPFKDLIETGLSRRSLRVSV